MSQFERDYIKRLLQQFARFLALIRKARDERKFDVGIQLTQDAYREVLGVPYELLTRVDIVSAAMLLRHPDKLRIYADLLRQEADLLRQSGQESDALTLEARADALPDKA
jgi:hypothetical protein